MGRARASSWVGMGIILKPFRGPPPPAALPSARRQPGSAGAHPGIKRPQQLTRRAHPPACRAQQLSAPVQSANNTGQHCASALSSADRCAAGLSSHHQGPAAAPAPAAASSLSRAPRARARPSLSRLGLSGPQGASRGGMGGTLAARASPPPSDHATQKRVAWNWVAKGEGVPQMGGCV